MQEKETKQQVPKDLQPPAAAHNDNGNKKPLPKRLLWFGLIWGMSVASLGILTYGIKLIFNYLYNT